MKKVVVSLLGLLLSVSCTQTKTVIKITHEDVQRATVGLVFPTTVAANGVIIHSAANNIFYVLTAAHVCNISVEISYIVAGMTTTNPKAVKKVQSRISLIQKSLDDHTYCSPKIMLWDQHYEEGTPIAIDFDRDLALFMFKTSYDLPSSRVDTEYVENFQQDIYIYGYAFYNDYRLVGTSLFGKIGELVTLGVNPATANSRTVLRQTSLGISNGFSGSGVYTSDHTLIGIVSAEMSTGPKLKPVRLSFFVPITQIREFLIESIEYYKNLKPQGAKPYCKSMEKKLCAAYLCEKFDLFEELVLSINKE